MVAVEREFRQDVATDRWAPSTEIRVADQSHAVVEREQELKRLDQTKNTRPDGE
jgi:hypothetical protein